jgi:DNA-binding MarR family transcriptional regulator
MVANDMDELLTAALEIRILISLAARTTSRALEQRLHAQKFPISGLQYAVLRLISRDQHTISELSRNMSLTPATLVPAVDVLERHGFLARGQDPADRRRTPLVLTARGAEVLAQVPAVHADEPLVRALAAIGPEKRASLLPLLRELLGAMPDCADAVREVARTINLMTDQSNGGDQT